MTPYPNIYGVIPSPTTVTVLTGRGTVSENCTHSIPMVNLNCLMLPDIGVRQWRRSLSCGMTSRWICQGGHIKVGCTTMLMQSLDRVHVVFVCHWVAHTQREGMGDCICTVVTLFEPDIIKSEHLNLRLGAYYACTSGEGEAVSLFTKASGYQDI